MFKVAVCDDEPIICEQLKQLIFRYDKASMIQVMEFYSGEALCNAVRSGATFELVILDIELTGMSGIQVGHFLQDELKAALILYISGKQEYAMELFDIRPLNFLIKPLSEEKVIYCLEQAMEAAKLESSLFEVNIHKVFYRIPFHDIRYFSSEDKKIIINLIDGSQLTYHEKLSEINEATPDDFILVHQSFLVNSVYIRIHRYDELTLDDGTIIPVSQAYRSTVRSFLLHCSRGK